MQRLYSLIVGLILVFVSVAVAGDLKVCLDDPVNTSGPIEATPQAPVPTSGEAAYSGTIRVFLVEPVSRWNDYPGTGQERYSNGLLDFPIVADVNMADGDIVYLSDTWDAVEAGFGWMYPDNITAIAVVYRSQTVLTDADPPNGYYFQARYSDAAAAATPFEIGRNEVTPPYTHPVFIEESTAGT